MVDFEKFKLFMNENGGFNGHNHIRFTVVEEGYCECQLDMTPECLNPQGVCHGSMLFTMCDCVTGVVAASMDRGMLTQCASIHFLRTGKSGTLTAKGHMVKSGRSTGLAVGEVFDEQGKLLCTSEFTVFYTNDHLVLPDRAEDGTWHSPVESTGWMV